MCIRDRYVSGITTDSTRYVWLTAASGQSFIDHANVRTNALIYDQSKGVGIVANPFAKSVIAVSYTHLNDTATNKNAIGFIDFGSVRDLTTGPFTIDFGGAGTDVQTITPQA